MHKSKLAGFVIDCETTDLDAAAAFWGEALGMPTRALSADDATYVGLGYAQHGLHVEVQQVEHPSRVHLDIETDDIPAEVARLERLGAKSIGAVKSWQVMEAPTGQRFCVVRPQSADFDEKANQWP